LQLDHSVAADDLPLLNMEELEKSPPMTAASAHRSFQQTKKEVLDLFEREYLEEALRRSNGNIAEAARASGKARRAFFELMRKHGVQAVSLGQLPQSA
jgi:DNA-binding NtrC family response regulator